MVAFSAKTVEAASRCEDLFQQTTFEFAAVLKTAVLLTVDEIKRLHSMVLNGEVPKS